MEFTKEELGIIKEALSNQKIMVLQSTPIGYAENLAVARFKVDMMIEEMEKKNELQTV